MTRSDKDPVTKWLSQIANGDSLAAQKIWEKYARRVEKSATRALRKSQKREIDEDDVVVAVLNSLFTGLKNGKIKNIENRWHLVALLNEMTRRKAAEARRNQAAKKRGGGKVRGDSGFEGLDQRLGSRGINAVPDKMPDPVEALARAESFARLLNKLEDPTLREVATLRIAKFTNAEIAEKLGVVERTVQRRVSEIKKVFAAELNKRKDD